MVLSGGKVAPGADIADASGTILFTDGSIRRMPVASSARALVADPSGMLESDSWDITFVNTASAVTITNGGPSGGTIVVTPAQFLGKITLRAKPAPNGGHDLEIV